MKSIVYEQYGGPEVLTLMQTKTPQPAENQIQIKVISSSVAAADWHLRKADPFMVRFMNGFFKPENKVLGQEFFGEITKTGANVRRFQKGDLVFGSTGLKTGAHSEYIVLDEQSVITKVDPEIATPELGTVPTGALTANYFLSQGNLNSSDHVLVNGASGSVGTYAVQIAKARGAQVTGVCGTENIEMVKSLGADEVIDYKKENFTNSNRSFTIIFDTVGNLNLKMVSKNLTKDGHFITTAFNLGLMIDMFMNSFRKGQKVFTGVTQESQESLDELTSLIKLKKLIPVIDRVYGMENIREAHEYAESGRKKGNLLINIAGGNNHV